MSKIKLNYNDLSSQEQDTIVVALYKNDRETWEEMFKDDGFDENDDVLDYIHNVLQDSYAELDFDLATCLKNGGLEIIYD